MAEQFLSDFGTPAINGMQARRVLANEILRGVAQGSIETNGRGVTQRFSNDTSGAQIRITQLMPFNLEGRELGASLNGENFNGNNPLQGSTNGLGVDVITVIDDNIDIPQVTMDMLPVDLLGNYVYNIQMAVNKNINAMTIGGKLVASLNDAVNGGMELITLDPTQEPDAMKHDLILGNAQLSNGAPEVGLDYFPDNDRCYVFRTSFVPALYKTGAIIVGGSNAAQDILAKGGVSVGASPRLDDGYLGEFMGVPVHMAGDSVWNLAAKYVGIPAWKLAKVYGYVSSGYANVRALAQGNEIKMIDAPKGQGVRLQPLFRMGFKSLYPQGNIFFVDTDFENPAEGGTLVLKGPASRPAYSSDTTLASVSFGGTAGTYNAGTNSWNIAVGSAISNGTFTNVKATAGDKAQVTYPIGQQTIATGANNFYFTVVAEDGKTSRVKVVVTKA